MPKYINGSTKRLTQLTGDFDPEKGVPHYNYTLKWGCRGTDLGANTFHDDATFIFFGDVYTPDKPETPEEIKQLKDTDMIAFIDHHQLIPGAGIAAAHQVNNDLLDVFYVDGNGRLYVSFVVKDGEWQGPIRITKKNIAAPGSPVATAHQVDNNQLNVFFTGVNGGLYVTWVIGDGAWQKTPYLIDKYGIVPAGAHIAADHQVDNNFLNVFLINKNRLLTTFWVEGTDPWQGPMILCPGVKALPGSPVATAHQVDNNVLNVFFTGENGGLFMTWVVGLAAWDQNHLLQIGSTAIVPPGAHMAADHQLDNNHLNVFFIGRDGALYVVWVVGRGNWEIPARISPKGIALPGSPVTTDHQVNKNVLNVFFAGINGELYVTWAIGAGKWKPPVNVNYAAKMIPKGGHFITAHQVNEDVLNIFFISEDKKLYVNWAVGSGKWQKKPSDISSGFRMTPLLEGDHFYPFKFSSDENTSTALPIQNTPSGAFSFNDKMYVFYFFTIRDKFGNVKDKCGNFFGYYSALGVSPDPFAATPYKELFLISDNNPGNSKFFQVAPLVIANEEYTAILPNLFGVPLNSGHSVILVGQGSSAIHLAWMLLDPVRGPVKETIRYYAGKENDTIIWTSLQNEAKAIIKLSYDWSSISVGRIPVTGQWILLYQHAGGYYKEKPEIWEDSKDFPIIARVANMPWDFETAQDLEIFNPVRENALGRYMERDDCKVQLFSHGEIVTEQSVRYNLLPEGLDHPSFAYGPYILNHYTEYDEQHKEVTIKYLMSTGRPYQVQVMQSRISLVRKRDFFAPWKFNWIKKIFK